MRLVSILGSKIRFILLALLSLGLLEFVSWQGWLHPWIGTAAVVILTGTWIYIASRNLGLAVVLLVAELVLESQGYLLSARFGITTISFRMVLFAAAFGFMLWLTLARRKFELWQSAWRNWYGLALFAIVWAAAVALVKGNGFANVFLDLNGYLYLLLAPLFFDSKAQAGLRSIGIPILTTVILWLIGKTFVVLYLFSHVQPEALLMLYRWWRQTGFGEITFVSGSLYRVFAQSQVYIVMAAAVALALLWRLGLRRTNGSLRLGLLSFLWVCLAATVATLSRSFWLGLVVAWALIPLMRWQSWIRYAQYLAVSIGFGVAAVGTVLAITQLPWPLAPVGTTSAEAFSQRFGTHEPAGESRLRLLGPLWQAVSESPILGSGYGAVVTYASTDPRLVAGTAGGSGVTTTYAFEWGYLDLWLKLGLIGMLLYLGIGIRATWRGLAEWHRGAIQGASVFVLVSLAILNITTPYLNHPLGLGAVMLVIAYAEAMGRLGQKI